MSKENVEVVRSVLEPFDGINGAEIDFGSDEIREILARTHSPDVELRTLESGIGTGISDVYRGWDGLVQYFRDWLEPFSEYRSKWVEYIDAGDRVLVPAKHWGIGSGSGARVEIELSYVFELRDGLITRIAQYDTLEDAREAEGIPASRTG